MVSVLVPQAGDAGVCAASPSLWRERGSSAEARVGGRASAPPQREEERWYEVVSPFKIPQDTSLPGVCPLQGDREGKWIFTKTIP